MVRQLYNESASKKLMEQYKFRSDAKVKAQIKGKFSQPKPLVWKRNVPLARGAIVEPRK
jgi:hypothetical protein